MQVSIGSKWSSSRRDSHNCREDYKSDRAAAKPPVKCALPKCIVFCWPCWTVPSWEDAFLQPVSVDTVAWAEEWLCLVGQTGCSLPVSDPRCTSRHRAGLATESPSHNFQSRSFPDVTTSPGAGDGLGDASLSLKHRSESPGNFEFGQHTRCTHGGQSVEAL